MEYRSVLQLFRHLPPISATSWPVVLTALKTFGTRYEFIMIVLSKSNLASPGDGDDFQSKAGMVFLELYGQADEVTRAAILIDLLKHPEPIPGQVLSKGLEGQ